MEAVDPKADIREAAEHLAPVLKRTPESLREAIIEARQRMVSRASEYADLHLKAAQIAAARGNSAPTEFALKHLSFDNERIIEAELPINDSGPKVLVSIVMSEPLGGTKVPAVNQLPLIDVPTE